jgi:hypothetical protein
MRVRVYVDGFNVCYGAKRRWASEPPAGNGSISMRSQRRWSILTGLTLQSWRLTTSHRASRFAQVVIRTHPSVSRRTCERSNTGAVTLYHGAFQLKQSTRPLVRDPTIFERFHDTEEKGSDVNLASRLLVDGFQDTYDAALIVSNDGDLKMPAELVRTLFRRPLGVLNPHPDNGRTMALSPPGITPPDFYAKITPTDFAACQLPSSMIDSSGRTIGRPAGC